MSYYPNEEEEFELLYGDELELMNELGKTYQTNLLQTEFITKNISNHTSHTVPQMKT